MTKFFWIVLFCQSSFAIDQKACSRLLNNGWFKKYEYGGIDQPLTKATKKHGVSKASSVTSTEGTTALSDPKYWTNVSTSETQSTSSTGECSLIGMQELEVKRNLYFAQNRATIIEQMAMGRGHHLETLSVYALCDDAAKPRFYGELQKHAADFIPLSADYGKKVDQLILANPELARACHSFPG